MDIGISKHHHLSEKADFSGNDGNTEGYWKVALEEEYINLYLF